MKYLAGISHAPARRNFRGKATDQITRELVQNTSGFFHILLFRSEVGKADNDVRIDSIEITNCPEFSMLARWIVMPRKRHHLLPDHGISSWLQISLSAELIRLMMRTHDIESMDLRI